MANGFHLNQQEVLPYKEFLAKYPERAKKLRFRVFAAKGLACIKCGLLGTHVVIWHDFKNPPALHNDLAAYKDGQLIMITMDHRIPRSLGGPKTIENLDTMCEPCNHAKGNKT